MNSVRTLQVALWALVLVAAGCAGINSSSTASQPNPTSTSASSTFVYVANTGSENVSAFKLTDDGALLPVPGSPFAMPGVKDLVISSGYLLASSQNLGVSAYKIDPRSGALRHISAAPISSGSLLHMAANSSQVYVSTTNGIYGFSFKEGTFDSIPGSPFFVPAPMHAFPLVPQRLLLESGGSYLFVGWAVDAVSGIFSAVHVEANGALTMDQHSEVGASETDDMVEDPSRRFIYIANLTIFQERIDPGTGAHQLVPSNDLHFGSALAMAPNGKFLLAAVSLRELELRTYAVDQSTGSLTEAASPVSDTGFAFAQITLDPSGRFLLLARGDDVQGLPPVSAPDSLSVLPFDQEKGVLSPALGTPAHLGSQPGSIVAVRF